LQDKSEGSEHRKIRQALDSSGFIEIPIEEIQDGDSLAPIAMIAQASTTLERKS